MLGPDLKMSLPLKHSTAAVKHPAVSWRHPAFLSTLSGGILRGPMFMRCRLYELFSKGIRYLLRGDKIVWPGTMWIVGLGLCV